MLLTLVPSTVSAVNYPNSVRVYNESGKIVGLGDKEYPESNTDANEKTGYDGTQTYVARYDKSTGTLYLKDYHGVAAEDKILAVGDLNIEVESNSSFTTSTTTTNTKLLVQIALRRIRSTFPAAAR